MAGVEGHALAFAGGCDVINCPGRQLRIRQHLVEGDARQLHRIALTYAQRRAREPLSVVTVDAEESRLHGAGPDIDACRDGHAATPSVWAICARRANSAAPRAPV